MIKYLFLMTLFSLSQTGMEGVYTRRQQMCSVAYTSTKEWTLTLQKDSSFIYTIKEDSTLTRKRFNIERRGSWSVRQDTLQLLSITGTDTVLFHIDGIQLEPFNKNEFSLSGFKLDFLRKK